MAGKKKEKGRKKSEELDLRHEGRKKEVRGNMESGSQIPHSPDTHQTKLVKTQFPST